MIGDMSLIIFYHMVESDTLHIAFSYFYIKNLFIIIKKKTQKQHKIHARFHIKIRTLL